MRPRRPFEEYGKTIRVEGGLKARSTRGAIGESWWSKRFLAVLESFALGTRLTRGRNYARAGQVLTPRGRRRAWCARRGAGVAARSRTP